MQNLRCFFGCFSAPRDDVAAINPRRSRDNTQNITPRVGNVTAESMRVISEMVSLAKQERAEQRKIWEREGADRYGRTPLHQAVELGDIKQVQKLCARSVDINIADGLGMSPLFFAVIKNQAPIVSELLKQGASLTCPEGDEITLACLAARNGAEDIMRILFNNNRESITRVSKMSGFSAVHEAARSNQVGILKQLVELGVDLNVRSERMDMPIDAARRAKSWGAVSYLKTPPSNVEAVQVIRGERKLNLEDINQWGRLENALGIEDLCSAVHAVFVSWINGDVDATDPKFQKSLANIFQSTINLVAKTYNIHDGSKFQFYYIAALKKLCKDHGLLSDQGNLDIDLSLTNQIKLDNLIEETRNNFRLCFEKIKFVGGVSQRRFESFNEQLRGIQNSLVEVQNRQSKINELFVNVAKRLANARYVSYLDSCLQTICQGAEIAGAVGLTSVGGLLIESLSLFRTEGLLNALGDIQNQLAQDQKQNLVLNTKMEDLVSDIKSTDLGEMTIGNVLCEMSSISTDEYVATQLKKVETDLKKFSKRPIGQQY